MVEPIQVVTTSDNVTKVVTPDAATQQTTPTETKPDQSVLDRVRQAKPDEAPKPDGETFLPEGFNVNDIQKITDPQARLYAENAYKSMQAGYTKKTQEISAIRKDLESQVTNAKAPQPWTVERVQQITKDPQFIAAAQQALTLNGGTGAGTPLSEEQTSMLSEGEKAQLREAQKANVGVVALQNQVWQMKRQQQDVELKERYASYDPAEIDQVERDLAEDRLVPTREHLYKVVKYDTDVQRAYELGRQDERGGIKEKSQITTTPGADVTHPGEVPVKEKGETNLAYWHRITNARLEQHRAGKL